jgi:hypothetical protein
MPYQNQGRPGMPLHDLVAEASRALVQLDAERLEELALSCQALNRNLPDAKETPVPRAKRELCEAKQEMASFGRVLEVTRGNLYVMRQVRNFEQGLLEYGGAGRTGWRQGATRDGNN